VIDFLEYIARSLREREREELRIYIYEGKRGKQILVIDVNSD